MLCLFLSHLFSLFFQKRKSSSSVQLMESSESTNTTIEDEDTKGRGTWPAEQTPQGCSHLPCCG
ncbi:calcium/calmodulin-dependent protein kinase II, alpha, isoform CRA_d [Rattus norvegicus]|uniref:Calcium/calmodulin-dependent protein kinase II, alpha, isoform CRA_d n=1 Tax=Rattus norvegicus TaxID=10116 RepID=A6IXF1_RAT|nr:calcium/calmodulin-dependent protein kinase II, alpha, isoform CRA_d [Rattus norvegicus]